MAIPDVIRALSLAADPPKRSGSPKKSGMAETIRTAEGKSVIRIDGADRKGVRITLLNRSGATRSEAEQAMQTLLDQHWID
jgi:ParB family chromosome partitioning protein